ncbi:MAG: hypothetical protein BWX80_03492 [Candidatus Hydrogenedentes bacterium ADurb.Bin101]|nr:MAG: hypothetical protein BWX80_03492 [Candidatus Hydrogenedentes bacterium ADurb.Bin101]
MIDGRGRTAEGIIGTPYRNETPGTVRVQTRPVIVPAVRRRVCVQHLWRGEQREFPLAFTLNFALCLSLDFTFRLSLDFTFRLSLDFTFASGQEFIGAHIRASALRTDNSQQVRPGRSSLRCKINAR